MWSNIKEKSRVVLPREIKHHRVYFVIGSLTRKEWKPAIRDAGDNTKPFCSQPMGRQPRSTSAAESLQVPGQVFFISLGSHCLPSPVGVTAGYGWRAVLPGCDHGPGAEVHITAHTPSTAWLLTWNFLVHQMCSYVPPIVAWGFSPKCRMERWFIQREMTQWGWSSAFCNLLSRPFW